MLTPFLDADVIESMPPFPKLPAMQSLNAERIAVVFFGLPLAQANQFRATE
jgi:hypothetical protein